ncbi:hypothetical protein LSH36_220g03000 [Paralvinella palmiformis]|uniref:IFT121/TULP4 N-terminal domain-containing protein n=1 Tax=Paralvinella palmiformis TaxID=53620 RepID=A0AAD9JPE1_9ANNE|nr:hypothetical protein LSH36_220g03000 [Paralvinella palmiformis]
METGEGLGEKRLDKEAAQELWNLELKVVLVKWNEPYQKLATCDVTGVIFVWIKHEGRWSIELINDRSSQVTDFTWSHDGRMALICYRDGFVLVGSVAGQRYWSSMLNLDSCLITCGAWSHDDQKVLFGTTDGQLIIMSAGGVMLSQITIQETVEVVSMVWACEKFYLSEQDVNTTTTTTSLATSKSTNQLPLLAVSFRTGAIYLVSNYDDLCPKVIHTGLTAHRPRHVDTTRNPRTRSVVSEVIVTHGL